MDDVPHPLLTVLLDAADGRFPPADGVVEVLPVLRDGQQAVLSLTSHAYLAVDRLPPWPVTAYGDETHPRLLQHLAGQHATIGCLDVTLVARGTGADDGRPPALPRRTDLDDHPRVRHARHVRRDVAVHADPRGLVTLADGLAGRRELSIEARPGTGATLLRDALALVPDGQPLFAGVAPGNARSLRALLRAGFTPLGSEVLLTP